jgi:hypothetical protein
MKQKYFQHLALALFMMTGVLSNCFAQTLTFSYTGSVQTFTVLPGTTSITVDMRGATGGGNSGTPFSDRPGYGARVRGT